MARQEGRPSLAVTVDNAAALVRLVNDLAPSHPWQAGEPVALGQLAAMLGLPVEEVRALIELINLGCGDALPGFFIEVDHRRQTLVPRHIDVPLARPLRLTELEANAALDALATAGIGAGDPLVQALGGALPLPSAPSPTSDRDDEGARSPSAATLALFAEAIDQRRPVLIGYRNRDGLVDQQRTVEPVRLSYDHQENAWYVHGWCRRAGGWRTFRLSRVTAASLLEETFEPREGAGEVPHALDNVDRASMAMLAIHDPQSLIDPDSWRGLVKVDYPLPIDRCRITDEEWERGAYIAAIPWNPRSQWLTSMVVQTLGGVEVLRPTELRAAVGKLAERMLEELGEKVR